MNKFDVVTASDSVLTAGEDRGTVEAAVEGVPVKALLLDSGTDTSLVARGVLDSIGQAGKPVAVRTIPPVRLSPVGGREVVVQHMATFSEIVLTTSAGPLMLRNLTCFVEEDNSRMELTVGRQIMKILGYSTDKLLVEARDAQAEWELGGDTSPKMDKDQSSPTSLQRICRLAVAAQDPIPDAEEEDIYRHETRTALPCMQPTNLAEVTRYLEAKVEIATRMGLTLDGSAKLRGVLQMRADSFRLEFGHDPPVRVAPMQVRLKPGATPIRGQPRRYSPNDRAFLDRHTTTLMKHGLIYKNHRSRWASAPRIVKKKEQADDPLADPRMKIDTRSVNERTEPMPWPMPVLEVVIGELEGAKVFFVLDWFCGYWQLPLHPDSQEIYSFVTHRGIYTPTRVPMGATDAVAYCQGVVEGIFGDLLGTCILAWLDDILGYAEDEASLLEVLDKVLERCEKKSLASNSTRRSVSSSRRK
ncbi:unnamed protein product [Phytophthora fragariaefolia]|uniref:Unnamed protein product n=1 Tax=Phytophthora fragariaefolia TaxID=1490495 RepID=A0A9W7CSP5_9STRA|nr:unnamed protein product [Phytophthora fragariaefolia]